MSILIKLFLCVFGLLLISPVYSINCACEMNPQKSIPSSYILRCNGQMTSGDCNCFINLPAAPAWHSGNAGICGFQASQDASGFHVHISGWKCANGEDFQTCVWNYTPAAETIEAEVSKEEISFLQ